MRHRVAGVKLGRSTAHRRALFRNLVTALLEREVVHTTDAKAKELRRWADRMITLGKQGTLHARRRAGAVIASRSVLKKLFDDIAPRYRERNGGYTRVVKLGTRQGDAASISLIDVTTATSCWIRIYITIRQHDMIVWFQLIARSCSGPPMLCCGLNLSKHAKKFAHVAAT